MLIRSATEVRKEWSRECDEAVRVRPSFIKRTRDVLLLSSKDMFLSMMMGYKFNASEFLEEDGSVTLSLDDMDIAENGTTREAALARLAQSILEYAEEFYDEYDIYSRAPNRKSHIPFIMKALALSDVDEIRKEIVCHAGVIKAIL